jgi:hypothetical protein
MTAIITTAPTVCAGQFIAEHGRGSSGKGGLTSSFCNQLQKVRTALTRPSSAIACQTGHTRPSFFEKVQHENRN